MFNSTGCFKKGTLAVLLVSCLIVSGCQASKRNTGTAIGALVGGAAGLFFGKGAGKALAVGIGALAGGFIGNQIGGYLDEQDRLAVEQESAKALSQADDGETVTWNNPDTKAEAEITIEKTEIIQREIPIVRHKEVAKPGKLTLIGEPYEIITDSNVRLGPSMDYDVAKVLKKGSIVLAVGQVQNKNWVLVNQDRHAIGYVHASLIEKEGVSQTKESTSYVAKKIDNNKEAKISSESAVVESDQKSDAVMDKKIQSDTTKIADNDQQQFVAMKPACNLDELPSDMSSTGSLREAIDLDDMVASYPDDETTKDYVAEKVEVEASARTIKMKVSTPNGEEETDVVASKGSDGAWEIL